MSEILYERRGHAAWITLNRPEAMNALTPAMMEILVEIWQAVRDDDQVLVAVLTGSGEKAFCAGADLAKLIPKVTSGEWPINGDDPIWLKGIPVYKPIIAAVNGHALAGGTELLQLTDIRVAADHATFGLPEPKWGLFPAGGSPVRLPRQIPWAIAMEMLLTGDTISAHEAHRIGLVSRVVPLSELLATVERIIDRICKNSPVAIRAIKEAALRCLAPWAEAFEIEAELARRVYASEDAKIGPAAFFERAKPVFKVKKI